MKTPHLLAMAFLFALGACTSLGEAGESCETDDDCADGLECHVEEHDHDHEEEEEEDHGDEGGTCEEPGEHDDHDHG